MYVVMTFFKHPTTVVVNAELTLVQCTVEYCNTHPIRDAVIKANTNDTLLHIGNASAAWRCVVSYHAANSTSGKE